MNEQTALTSHQITIDASITEWLYQKENRTGSQRTRRAYQDTITSFRDMLATVHLDLLSNPVDVARVAAIWATLRSPRRSQRTGLEKPVAANTYNQRLAILSSWYTFVQERYHIEIPNPMETKEVKRRPVQAYARAAAEKIAPEEVEGGMDAIDRKSLQGLRDYALLTVALATGRRASELVGLRGQHIKIMQQKDTLITLTFHCKGDKIQHDRLDPDVSAILLEYLQAQHGEQPFALPADTPIWVSYSRANAGKAIGTRTLGHICKQYLHTSKIHSLRHTFVREMIKSGAPITVLKERLAHSDVRTTMVYADQVGGDENPYAEKLTKRFGFKRHLPDEK